MVGSVSVSISDTNSRIKILKINAHLHIIGRKSTKYQVNPMKMYEELQRQDLSDGLPDGWMGRRMDGRNNAHNRTRVISIVPLRLRRVRLNRCVKLF